MNKPAKKFDFTLVIPAKNEADRINATLKKYCSFFEDSSAECRIEIIVVIADTTDATYSKVKKYSEKYPFVKIINTPYSTGKGGAVGLGFQKGNGKYVGFADADGAVSAAEIFRLYKLLRDTAWLDAVIGSRKVLENRITLKRRLIAFVYNFYVRYFIGLNYQDTQCGIKIFKANVAKDLSSKLLNLGWTFDVNVLLVSKYLNLHILECPVVWDEKAGSKFSLLEGLFTVPIELFRLKISELKYKNNSSFSNHSGKKKKRLLIFAWRDFKHPERGGSEVYVHNVAKRLAKKYVVSIFTSQPSNLTRYDEVDGVRIFRRGNKFTVYFWAFFYYFFRFRYRTDVVIDVENGIPFFSPIYSSKPVILLVHHVHKRQWFIQFSAFVAAAGYILEIFLMPLVYKTTKVVTVSQSSMLELIQIGFSSSKVYLGYNSIPIKIGGSFSKYSTPTLLCFGRVKAYKRVELAIKSFAQINKSISGVRLLIGGGGDHLNQIKKLTNKLGLSAHVSTLGYVSDIEKWELMQRSWLLLAPSSKEGWGISIIEAAACGTPAVGFNVPGIRDSIRPNYSGILVEEGDTHDWAKQVEGLIKYPKVLKKYGDNAKVWASKFSWKNTADVFELLIEEASSGKSFMLPKTYPWELDFSSDLVSTLADVKR